MLTGCSTNPTLEVPPEDWVYEKKAISIDVRATADLNSVSGRPHALSLFVYQLSDTNTFTGMTTTREGTIELLNEGKIDSTVVQFNRVDIQPGETRKIELDRAQLAQYVGVIAAYNALNPALDVRLFEVPMVPADRGVVDKMLAASSLIADEAKARPDKLYLKIELEGQGTRSMKDVTAKHVDD